MLDITEAEVRLIPDSSCFIFPESELISSINLKTECR